MPLATSSAGPVRQRFYQRRVVHPMVWAILFSVCVHSVLLLQTFLFKASHSTVDNATVLTVRWLAPPLPTLPSAVTVNTPEFKPAKNLTESVQAATKTEAVKPKQPASPIEAARSASQEPSMATPAQQANVKPALAYDGTPQATPSISPNASPSADSGTGSAPSTTAGTTRIDLSQTNLARAAKQANASSLAYKAREHTGLEPEARARVFAKGIAATAVPSCWSDTQDGEGQALVAPSGNVLLLPLAARAAALGKCKVIR
jgi:hypothetical protein